MSGQQIRFADGGGYERSMGVWSRSAGEVFLDWLQPKPGLSWLDIGCGSGAFTELLVECSAPAGVTGVDPSEEQLTFARARHAAGIAEFRQAEAMQLPFADGSFDAAVMALVLFFVPDPAKGLAEMARVVRRGGIVGAYLWDFAAGGFPFEPIHREMRAVGAPPLLPPSVGVSGMTALRDAWLRAGFVDVETRTITVSRSFASFDEFWNLSSNSSAIRPVLDGMPRPEAEQLRSRVHDRLPAGDDGRVAYQSVANAIKGRVPA